jgi:pyridinium-3,5-bisthiocarboxylic acid mononucleotide nickel chelatase
MQEVIAYLDCHSGISGDMFLGALLDLDADISLDGLRKSLAALPLEGYELKLEPYQDKGILGSRFEVMLTEHDAQSQPLRGLSDIKALLYGSTLSSTVREMALSMFQCLANAEAIIHGTSIEEVHFHEVGAIDAIVDITGAAIALEALGITQLYASSLPLSSGHVQTSHGALPVPAPATLEILRHVPVPWKPSTAEGEMVTPTGAAILATLANFQTPALFIERVGYGFGRKQFPWPNCLRVCMGRSASANRQRDVVDTDWVTVIESNIDNMSGELLGGLMDKLFAAGALDVNYTPIQMKKNRPAVTLTIICQLDDGNALSELLLRESSTLGVRISQVQRIKAQRDFEPIQTPLGIVTMKVKRLGKRVISAIPEFEDCRRLALEKGIPLEDVYDIVQQAMKTALK